MSEDYRQADRDMGKGHPLLQARWLTINAELARRGFLMLAVEVYRPDLRQQWLFGQGRSVPEVQAHGISPAFARPGPIVTNAWNCHTSAHGWTEQGRPAAAALDCVPLGPDGKAFTRDDPWDAFVALIASIGPAFGLVHFHAVGKQVTDKPHLQLIEWSDREHRLILTP